MLTMNHWRGGRSQIEIGRRYRLPGTAKWVLSALFALGLCSPDSAQETKPTPGGSAPAAQALSLADLIERTEPSCVRLDVRTREGRSIGSGFVVDDQGWVVTNHHVVEGALSAVATFHDGGTADVEGFLAYDEKRDVAVVKLKTTRRLKFLPLAVDKPRKGESTVAIGSPQGLSFTATEGIISAIRDGVELKAFNFDAIGTWLQTSTPISPGSSGGPLLNLKGEVLGANSGSLASAQNLNFAISAGDISAVIGTASKSKLRDLTQIPAKASSATASSRPRNPGGIPDGPSEDVVAQLPAQRRFVHKFKISKEEDEFDKVIWLRTEWMPLEHNDRRLNSCGLRVGVPFREDSPPPALLWEVGTSAQSFAFIGPGARHFQLLVDGESYDLGDPRHKGDIVGRGVTESLTTALTIQGFTKVIMAKEVRARVGTLEFKLSAGQLECLRDLASRLPEGETVDGVKVERYPVDKDPSAGGKKAEPKPNETVEKPATPGTTDKSTPTASGDQEQKAGAKLRLARQLLGRDPQSATARRYLEQILDEFPSTEAAKEARRILDGGKP